MRKEQKEDDPREAYEDFLTEISHQFARSEQEKDFMESIRPEVPEEHITANVGERVRQVRDKRGLSLEDVSQRTDIDVSILSQIEEGAVAPPLGTVIKLAKALEMRMGYFISGEEDRPYTIVRHRDRKVVSRYDSRKPNITDMSTSLWPLTRKIDIWNRFL